MTTKLRTNFDPTETTSLRERFESRYNSRWRNVRGEVRRELTDDRGIIHDLRADRGVGSRQFRSFLKRTIRSEIFEPVNPSLVRRGNHWTGAYIRDAYKKGLRSAKTQLKNLGASEEVADRATRIHRDPHQDGLRSQFIAIYDDTEDTFWSTTTDASREFKEAFEEGDSSASELVSVVNDRIDAKGQTSTSGSVHNRIVETYNGAMLVAFALGDVSAVGVIPESSESERVNSEVDFDKSGLLDRTREHFDWAGARAAIDESVDLSETIPEGHLPEQEFAETVFDWVTAGDDRVCEMCQAASSGYYSLQEVLEGSVDTPPLHPRCRCSLVAINRSGS